MGIIGVMKFEKNILFVTLFFNFYTNLYYLQFK